MKRSFWKILIASVITVVALVVFTKTLVSSVFVAPKEKEITPAWLIGNDDAYTATSSVTSTSSSSSTSTGNIASEGQVASASTTPHEPVKLIIPGINVNASIVKVGVNPNGNMGTPSRYSDVGWYKYGAKPGEKGSAVLAGHVDNGLQLAGVFKNLSNMKIGDPLSVVRSDGTAVDFEVVKIDTFPYDAAPSNLIFNQNDDAYIKLITCVGRWNADQTYDLRLVVTAKAL